MPKKINLILRQFISEISEILGDRLKKVILYGSYARRRLSEKLRY